MSNRTSWPAGVKRTTTPTWQVVTTESQKDHSHIDTDADATLLQSYIDAATEFAEKEQDRCIRQATWTAVYDCWPSCGVFYLPKPPLVSVTSITYYDTAGASQTLATSYYVADVVSEPGRIQLVEAPPSIDDRPGAITVTYVAGYANAAAVPAITRHAIRQLSSLWYRDREPVVVGAGVAVIPFSVQDLLNQNKFLSYR